MVIAQGDVYWANLPVPKGSEPGFRRPVVVLQSNSFNRSGLRTVLCVPCSGNLTRVGYPGQVLLKAGATGLPQDSVASVFQLTPINKDDLIERIGSLGRSDLDTLFGALDQVLGR